MSNGAPSTRARELASRSVGKLKVGGEDINLELLSVHDLGYMFGGPGQEVLEKGLVHFKPCPHQIIPILLKRDDLIFPLFKPHDRIIVVSDIVGDLLMAISFNGNHTLSAFKTNVKRQFESFELLLFRQL